MGEGEGLDYDLGEISMEEKYSPPNWKKWLFESADAKLCNICASNVVHLWKSCVFCHNLFQSWVMGGFQHPPPVATRLRSILLTLDEYRPLFAVTATGRTIIIDLCTSLGPLRVEKITWNLHQENCHYGKIIAIVLDLIIVRVKSEYRPTLHCSWKHF